MLIESLESRTLLSAPLPPTDLTATATFYKTRVDGHNVQSPCVVLRFHRPAIPKTNPASRFFEYVTDILNDGVVIGTAETRGYVSAFRMIDLPANQYDYFEIASVFVSGPRDGQSFAESAFSAGAWVETV